MFVWLFDNIGIWLLVFTLLCRWMLFFSSDIFLNFKYACKRTNLSWWQLWSEFGVVEPQSAPNPIRQHYSFITLLRLWPWPTELNYFYCRYKFRNTTKNWTKKMIMLFIRDSNIDLNKCFCLYSFLFKNKFPPTLLQKK